MKGVYRLANAQLGQNDVDAAEDTVRKGLARDAENPELKKLVRVIKGRRDKAKRKAAVQAATGAADEARGAAGVDEATKPGSAAACESGAAARAGTKGDAG